MKLVRFGAAGREKPGIVDAQGHIRDLSKVVKDIDGAMLDGGGLAKIKKANIDKLPLVKGKPRLGPCVGNVRNFIAIGLNYADHAAEAGAPIPKEPIIFSKAPTCICGPNDNTIIPKESTKLDYEIELGIVIGKRARYLAKDKAMSAVAGYFLANDVSERAFQIDRSGGQWDKGKGCETFGPIGPWFVTRDEIKDPQNLDMWLTVNGETPAEGQYAHDDLRRRAPRLVLLAVLRDGAGRHHRHRHAAGRRARHEADAEIPQCGRRREARHRRARRADAEDRGVEAIGCRYPFVIAKVTKADEAISSQLGIASYRAIAMMTRGCRLRAAELVVHRRTEHVVAHGRDSAYAPRRRRCSCV